MGVAPRAKQLRAVEELSDEMGDDVGIILLNARLRFRSRKDNLLDRIALEFNPVFHLRLLGEPGAEGVVYHEALNGGDGPWIFARRQLEVKEDGSGEGFVSKEFQRFDREPTAKEVAAAFAR